MDGRRQRPRAARTLYIVAVASAVSVVAGFAAAITISQTNYSSLFGDISNVGTSLSVASTSIGVVKSAASAAGTSSGAAVEMANGASGNANTALTKAHWQYKAVVQESAAAAVTSGTYEVKLLLDDVSQGSLFMTQATSDTNNVEGVTLKWDIGADMPTGDTAFQIVIT